MKSEDLTEEQQESIDRKIAESPEGRALLRRVHLPEAKWRDYQGVLTDEIQRNIIQEGLAEIFARNMGDCLDCGKPPQARHHCDRWDCPYLLPDAKMGDG